MPPDLDRIAADLATHCRALISSGADPDDLTIQLWVEGSRLALLSYSPTQVALLLRQAADALERAATG